MRIGGNGAYATVVRENVKVFFSKIKYSLNDSLLLFFLFSDVNKDFPNEVRLFKCQESLIHFTYHFKLVLKTCFFLYI